ncbi:O90/O127 family O-antigen flippase [Morganella morganii]|nr:O90/O127 family O-antigen flippase [Morganella morganii]
MGFGILLLYPIYIKILGEEQWGLVSACISIQAMLMILDVGFSQIMPRDIAQAHSKLDVNNIYQSYFLYYFTISILGGSLIFIFSNWLSENWFNAESYISELKMIIKIASLQFIFQFLNSVNSGFWNGIQNQKITNISQVSFFTLKHISSLLLLMIYPSAIIYIICFTSITIIEFFTNFTYIKIKNKLKVTLNRVIALETWNIVKNNSSFSLGVILGVCVSQLDKILFSQQLSIKEYGIYVVVAQLGLAFLQLQYPVMKAIIPAVSARGKDSLFNIISPKYIMLLAIFTLSPALFTSIYSYEILLLWTGNEYIAHIGHLALSLICLSVILNLPYGFIYANLLRKRKGFVILIVNFTSILIMLSYYFCYSNKENLMTGGVLWLIYAFTSLIIGCSSLYFINKKKSINTLYS